jgi:hypothetical protein
MDTLHIDLQDGFRGHTVTVAIEGRTVYQQTNVSTDLTISRADGFETQAPAEHVSVRITAEPGNICDEYTIAPGENPFLAISIDRQGGVHFTPSKETFRYM